jgi:cystathionine beta-lyase
VSKTFNLPGLHVSNIIIPDSDLRKRFADTVASCGLHWPNLFGIAATEAAYRYCETWLEALIKYLKGNVDFLLHFVEERIPGIKVMVPQGTYLVWLDCRALPIPRDKMSTFIIEEAKVGAEEGQLFRAREPGFWRLNIGCPRSLLCEALERLEKAVARLS